MNVIEFVNVSKSYNGKLAVADFSLEISEGERIVLLGPSGSGKTTVLRILAGFIPPDKGKITIDGVVVAADGVNLMEPEKRGLGMVFQDLALWPHMTVRENLEFGLKAKGLPGSQREARIREIVSLVQMNDYLDAKPSTLSGGQQQRVALARALVLQPRSLLMDEPLSSLDHDLNQRLRDEILHLHDKLQFALVYITHDREEAFDIGTRIIVMNEGKIEQSGPVSSIKDLLLVRSVGPFLVAIELGLSATRMVESFANAFFSRSGTLEDAQRPNVLRTRIFTLTPVGFLFLNRLWSCQS